MVRPGRNSCLPTHETFDAQVVAGDTAGTRSGFGMRLRAFGAYRETTRAMATDRGRRTGRGESRVPARARDSTYQSWAAVRRRSSVGLGLSSGCTATVALPAGASRTGASPRTARP